jgi:hypothetical protein
MGQRLVGYDSVVVLSAGYGSGISQFSGAGTFASGAYTPPSGGIQAVNIFDGSLNLSGDKIEVTTKGDFPWRSYRAGFKDATISAQVRNDPEGQDVNFLRQRTIDGEVFLFMTVDNYKKPTQAWLSMPVTVTSNNNPNEFQSSQDLSFELSPAISQSLGIIHGGTWGNSVGGGQTMGPILSFASDAEATAGYGGSPVTGQLAVIGGTLKEWDGSAWVAT